MMNLPHDWLYTIVDASLKSVILAVTATLLLRLFRVRNTTARHRVWSGVLLGMLALPLLSRVMPSIPLPLDLGTNWSTNSAEGLVGKNSATSAHDLAYTATAPVVDKSHEPKSVADTARMMSPRENMSTAPAYDQKSASLLSPPARSGTAQPVTSSPQVEPTPSKTITQQSVSETHTGILPYISLLIAMLWLIGTGVMLLRLLAGITTATRIVRHSHDVGADVLLRIQNANAGLPIAESPRIRQSSAVSAPVTVGMIRPRILLPCDWQEWSDDKLHAVLSHELTHIVRHDPYVSLVCELNRCLYWFHPLSWWLRTHLSDLAEEACDDAAIGLTGNPTAYARHLLEVAADISAHRGRVIQPGLSMARKSNVEGRINTILDFTRPLSRQLTRRATLLIITLTVPVIAVAAALRPAITGDRDDRADSITRVASLAGPRQSEETAKNSDTDVVREYELSGQVVDPSGSPVDNATLYLVHWNTRHQTASTDPIATTLADGTFRVTVPAEICEPNSRLIAVAEGYGFAHDLAPVFDASGDLMRSAPDYLLQSLRQRLPATDRVLRLQPDQNQISGTVRDTEGNQMRPDRIVILAVADGDIEAWEQAAAAKDADYQSVSRHMVESIRGEFAQLAATEIIIDDEGSFRIHGIGDNRLVTMAILGPNIGSDKIIVRTRAGKVVRFQNQQDAVRRYGDNIRHTTVYANQLTVVCSGTQLVTGQVTDSTTGLPVPDCEIRASRISSDPIPGFDRAGFIRTKTNQNGEYRLQGLPIGMAQFTLVPPRNSDFIRSWYQVKLTPKDASIQKDIALTKGIRVSGTVKDLRTDRPVQGHAEVFASRENPKLQGKKRLRLPNLERPVAFTDREGHFEVLVVPGGKNIIAFRANNIRDYLKGSGSDDITVRKADVGMLAFDASPSYVMPANYNVVTEVDASSGREIPELEISLDSGSSLKVSVQDQRGLPVQRFRAFGRKALTFNWLDVEGSELLVEGLHAHEPRQIFIWKPETNQSGSLLLQGPRPTTQPVIRLQTAVIIRGRIVDQEGQPRTGIRIESGHFGVFRGETNVKNDPRQGMLVTDRDGRFEIRGLCPGVKYSARAVGPASMSSMWQSMAGPGGPMIRYGVANIFKDIVVESGVPTDLGDIACYPGAPDPAAVANQPAPETVDHHATSETASPDPNGKQKTGPAEIFAVSGVVVDSAGQPVPAATVSLRRVFERTAYARPRTSSLITELRSDSEGRFTQAFTADQMPTQFSYSEWLSVEVRANGHGFHAQTIRNFDDLRQLKMSLPDEVLISGRILDPEGQPVTAANLRILDVSQADSDKLTRFINQALKSPAMNDSDMQMNLVSVWDASASTGQQFPAQERFNIPIESFPTFQTDKDGRVQIAGIGKDQMLEIEISGRGIAKSIISVLGRDLQTRNTAQDKEHPSKGKVRLHTGTVPFHGCDFTCIPAPSQPVEGVVRDLESGEPLVGAIVSVDSTAGSPMSREGWLSCVTNEEGYYRIEGLPTAGKSDRYPNRLSVFAKGQPYLITSFRVAASAEAKPIVQDLKLRKAVFAVGRLLNHQTNEPVDGYLCYTPFSGNPANTDYPQYSDGTRRVITQDRFYRTDDEGRFRIPVIPGRGLLAARSIDGGFKKAFGIDRLPEFRNNRRPFEWPTSDFIFADDVHTLSEINVPDNTDEVEVSLACDPGRSIQVNFVDAQGMPYVSPLHVSGLQAIAGRFGPVQGGKAEITGLAPDEQRVIHVRSADGRVARIQTIAADMAESATTIRVQPLVRVSGKLMSEDGRPIANRSLGAFSVGYHNSQISLPTKTKQDGTFTLVVPSGGPYQIRVRDSRPETVKSRMFFESEATDLGDIRIMNRKSGNRKGLRGLD